MLLRPFDQVFRHIAQGSTVPVAAPYGHIHHAIAVPEVNSVTVGSRCAFRLLLSDLLNSVKGQHLQPDPTGTLKTHIRKIPVRDAKEVYSGRTALHRLLQRLFRFPPPYSGGEGTL